MAGNKRVTMQLRGLDQDGGDVRFDNFINQLEYFKKALQETQCLITDKKIAYFKIVDLRHNSPAQIVVEAVPILPEYEKQASEIIDRFFFNVDEIQEGNIPEGFSYQTLEAYKNLTHLQKSHQLSEILLSGNGDQARNLEQFSKNIDVIVGDDEFEIGSFTGMLEYLNIHGDSNVFNLYQASPNLPKLKCVFPKKLRAEAIGAVGQYVRVVGEKKYKPKLKDSQPFEMNVEKIEVIPGEANLPKLSDLRGIAPNATGDQSSEDFIRGLRDGWK